MSLVNCLANLNISGAVGQPGKKPRKRRSGNKKKSNSDGNVEQNQPKLPNPPPPISAKFPKKDNRPKKTIKKTVADFKCTSENCGKSWSSVHAWASRKVTCDMCDGKAKVVQFTDEMCELDYYGCQNCDNFWQTMHDVDTLEQQCDICDTTVMKANEIQSRHGRHFWHKCLNRECAIEWEDFYEGKMFSQRCKVCFSAGEMIRTRKMSSQEVQIRRGRWMYGTGGGHDVEGCDMCHELQRQGVAQSCRPKRVVVFDVGMRPADGSDAGLIIATI